LTAFLFLKEAYGPVLLERKAKKIRRSYCPQSPKRGFFQRFFNAFFRRGAVKQPNLHVQGRRVIVRVEGQIDNKLRYFFRNRLVLPFIMMFTHPAVVLPSLFRAYLYGVMYLVVSTFPFVWEGFYGQSRTDAQLNNIPALLGILASLYMTSNVIDKVS
jgi:hypothetical protein